MLGTVGEDDDAEDFGSIGRRRGVVEVRLVVYQRLESLGEDATGADAADEDRCGQVPVVRSNYGDSVPNSGRQFCSRASGERLLA